MRSRERGQPTVIVLNRRAGPTRERSPPVGWIFPVDRDTAGYRGTNASSQQSSPRLPLKAATHFHILKITWTGCWSQVCALHR